MRRPLFSGCRGLDRQSVHSLIQQIAERRMDQALAVDPRLAGEGRAFDAQREMALARWIVTAVAAMLLAVVDQLDMARRKR